MTERNLSSAEPIYETEYYEVLVGECVIDSPFKGTMGYLLRNKRTGVIEGEVTGESTAIKVANQIQAELEQAIEAPDEFGKNFEDVMRELDKELNQE